MSLRFLAIFATAVAATIAAAVIYLGDWSSAPVPGTSGGVSLKAGGGSQAAAAPVAMSERERETAAATLQKVLGAERGFDRTQRIERLGYEVVLKDPEAALADLAAVVDPADRAIFLRGMFTGAAQLKAAEALKLAKRVKNGLDRDQALLALATAWRGGLSPVLGGRAAGKKGGGFDGSAVSLGASLLDGSPARSELAAAWAWEILEGDQQADLLSAAARQLAATDPQRALAIGEGLEGSSRERFIGALANGWAEAQPDAVFAWATQLGDARQRKLAMRAAIARWAVTDPSLAMAAIGALPAGEARTGAVLEFSSRIAWEDTRAGLQWAGTLAGAERAAAEQTILAMVPVGTGAVFGKADKEGYPVVNNIVPDSPLGRSGQMLAGSRVVAFSDAAGRMIDTKGVDPRTLSQRMRGAEGTPIILHIESPGASQVQQVQVARGQLYLKLNREKQK